MFNWFKKQSVKSELADILAGPSVQEDLLGVAQVSMPTPEKIHRDAAAINGYSQRPEYKIFAKEVFARALAHLDVIMDDKATTEKLHFHRGAFKAHLDLLRLSYQARQTQEELEKQQNASLQR